MLELANSEWFKNVTTYFDVKLQVLLVNLQFLGCVALIHLYQL